MEGANAGLGWPAAGARGGSARGGLVLMNRRTSLHVFSDLWLATLAEWFCSLSGPLVGLHELARLSGYRGTLSARRRLTVQVKSRHEVSVSERILCRRS